MRNFLSSIRRVVVLSLLGLAGLLPLAFAESIVGQRFAGTDYIVQDLADYTFPAPHTNDNSTDFLPEPTFIVQAPDPLDPNWAAACERAGADLLREINTHQALVENNQLQAGELAQTLSAVAALAALQRMQREMREAESLARLKWARLEGVNQICGELLQDHLAATGSYRERVALAVAAFNARFITVEKSAGVFTRQSDAAAAARDRAAAAAADLERMLRPAPLADKPQY